MIKINICGTEHEYDDYLESWISERYHNIKRLGGKFWFKVHIDDGDIHLILSSVNAPHGRGTPDNRFSRSEKRIVDIWREMGAKKYIYPHL